VNLNLAPVADLSDPGSVMDTRAFPGDTAAVAGLIRASVKGYAGTGVAPTLKHFPGLGATDGNTDKVAVTIRRPAKTIGYVDLPSFKSGIDAGAPAVMLSHALYPSLDPNRIASQSRPIIDGLLRKKLGFTGVTMTDSLEAYSVLSRSSLEAAAVRSMRAGVDIILMTGAGSHIRIQRAFRARAKASPAFRARLGRAATRIGTLQEALQRG
jgi:beta-N-acetylhexosaminidase